MRWFPVVLILLPCALLLSSREGAYAEEGRSSEPYLRAVEEGARLSLDVAVREFVPAEGEGTRVWLVGVIHIGDEAYYRRLQTVLDLQPAVLYESVLPPGVGRLRDAPPEAQTEDTRARLAFLAEMVEGLRRRNVTRPDDLDALANAAGTIDARLRHFVERAVDDAWGRTIRYEALASGGYRLLSLGADGAPGGEGAAADIEAGSATREEAPPGLRSEPFDLQREFASALGLAHQGDVVKYGGNGWTPSDMAIDELRRAVEARGGDFTKLEEALAAKGLRGFGVRMVLGLLRLADAMSDGEARRAVKVSLIEALAADTPPESNGWIDEATFRAIIEDRNAVVMQDLDRLLSERPDLRSVAVFYGAGHMPDFERRLATRGYRPARTRWLRALHIPSQP